MTSSRRSPKARSSVSPSEITSECRRYTFGRPYPPPSATESCQDLGRASPSNHLHQAREPQHRISRGASSGYMEAAVKHGKCLENITTITRQAMVNSDTRSVRTQKQDSGPEHQQYQDLLLQLSQALLRRDKEDEKFLLEQLPTPFQQQAAIVEARKLGQKMLVQKFSRK